MKTFVALIDVDVPKDFHDHVRRARQLDRRATRLRKLWRVSCMLFAVPTVVSVLFGVQYPSTLAALLATVCFVGFLGMLTAWLAILFVDGHPFWDYTHDAHVRAAYLRAGRSYDAYVQAQSDFDRILTKQLHTPSRQFIMSNDFAMAAVSLSEDLKELARLQSLA